MSPASYTEEKLPLPNSQSRPDTSPPSHGNFSELPVELPELFLPGRLLIPMSMPAPGNSLRLFDFLEQAPNTSSGLADPDPTPETGRDRLLPRPWSSLPKASPGLAVPDTKADTGRSRRPLPVLCLLATGAAPLVKLRRWFRLRSSAAIPMAGSSRRELMFVQMDSSSPSEPVRRQPPTPSKSRCSSAPP